MILYFVVGIASVVFAAFVLGIGVAGGIGTTSLVIVGVVGLVGLLVVIVSWFLT